MLLVWAAAFGYALVPVWQAMDATVGFDPQLRQQDFRDAIYYPARELLRGGNPYDPASMFAHWPVRQEFDLYLPEHFVLALPFALLPFREASLLHGVFVALVVSGIGVLAARAAGLGRRWAVGLAAFLLLSQTGGAQVFLGQVGAVTGLGAALALRFAGRRPMLAAGGLAVAWVKPQYGVPLTLLFLAAGHRREAVRGTLLAFVASLPVVGVLVARFGPGGFVASLRRNLEYAQQTSYGAVDSMEGMRVDLGAVLARSLRTSIPAVELFVLVGVLAIAAWALRRLRGGDPHGGLDPTQQLLIGLAVLIAVVHQPGDGLFLFPAMVAAVVGLRAGTTPRPTAVAALACLPQFLFVHRVIQPLTDVFGRHAVRLVEGVAYAAAFVVLVVHAARNGRTAATPDPPTAGPGAAEPSADIPAPTAPPDDVPAPAAPPDDGPPGERDLRAVAARGVAWLGLVNLVAKGMQVLVTFALARFLSPGELGLVSLTVAVLNFAGLLQTMGLFDVVSRTRRDPQLLAGTLVTMGTTAGAVLGTAGFLAAPLLADALRAPAAAELFRAVSVCLPAMAYGGIQVALMARRLQYERRVVSDGGSAVLGAATTIALTAAGWGARGAVIGLIVAAIAGPLLGLAAGIRIRPAWSRTDAREALGWAWVAGPGALLGLAILNVDYLVTTRVLGEAATGVYSLAYRIAFLPYIMGAVVISGVAFPVFAQLSRDHRRTELRDAVTGVLGVSATVVVGAYAVLFAAADQIVLLGDKWAGSVTPLRILCLYGVLFSVSLTGLDALRATGWKERYFAVQAVHFVILTGCAVAFTTAGGIVGTAWAQVLAASLAIALSLTWTGGSVGLRLLDVGRVVWAPVAAGGVIAAVVAGPLASRLAGPASLGTAVLVTVGSALGYLAVLAGLDRSSLRRSLNLVRRDAAPGGDRPAQARAG